MRLARDGSMNRRKVLIKAHLEGTQLTSFAQDAA